MATKQIIVIRKDLKMRRGKEVAQSCHASLAFLSKKYMNNIPLTDAEKEWLDNSYAKICLVVNSEEELIEIHQNALDAGLESNLIIDSGKTEFHGVLTKTCVAIGPDYCEKIDPITSNLTLY
jgi:PTH2 family peptidyl-tRNA hydrolase